MTILPKKHLAFLGMLNPVNMKFRCLQAWCLSELEEAEYSKGQTVVEDGTRLRGSLNEIINKIKRDGNTHAILSHLALKDKRIGKYYNIIGKIVSKHFKLNDEWIPAMIVLSVLQEYTLRGHKCFEDVNFTDLLDMFNHLDKETKKKHYDCAFEIVETVSKMKVGLK